MAARLTAICGGPPKMENQNGASRPRFSIWFYFFLFFFRVFEKFRFDPPFKLGPTTENPVKLGTIDIDGLKLVKLN